MTTDITETEAFILSVQINEVYDKCCYKMHKHKGMYNEFDKLAKYIHDIYIHTDKFDGPNAKKINEKALNHYETLRIKYKLYD